MTQLTAAPAVTPIPSIQASRKWLTLFLTSLGIFMVTLDVTIVNVAFPAIQRSFSDASRGDLSWVLSSYAIVFAAFLVAAGKVADRFGRKLVFFAGLLCFSTGSALCGLAPSVELLVGGRVIQAVGAAFMTPASLGLALAAFPPAQRATAVAIWGAVASIAAATGPSLGAVLVDGPGWRWAFYINLPVAALALAWGSSVLEESRDPNARSRPDLVGVALIAAAMGLLALGIVQGEDWGWTDWRVIGAFAGSAVALPLFVWRCAAHNEPVVDLALFRIRSFSVANAATVAYGTAFFSMLLASVLFLTSVWDYSVLRAGLALTPAPLSAGVASVAGGRLAHRAGFRTLIVTGALLMAGSMAWMVTRIGGDPAYAAEWLPMAIPLGTGIGLAFPMLNAASVSAVPPERFAVGSAVHQVARQLGSVLGVAILVAILGTPATREAALDRFDTVFAFSGSMALLAGVLAMLLGSKRRSVGP